MKNYFETQRVNWKTWNPSQVIFKSNQLVKKLLPEDNILSWTSKGDRNLKMCELTGGKVQKGYQGRSYPGSENLKGVMVQLKDVKSDFPSANIDFIDYTSRKDSVGSNLGRLDVLVYLNSFHNPWTYQLDPITNQYIKATNGKVCPIEEGYRMCYGGQGDSNSMGFEEFKELIEITESVKNFLVEVVIPYQNGSLDLDLDLVA